MELEEANKIIAEFMGYNLSECGMYWESKEYAHISIGYEPEWSDSLDALVPVWEKLRVVTLEFKYIEYDCCGWFLDINEKMDLRPSGELGFSIQEAACIATAKAIKELE